MPPLHSHAVTLDSKSIESHFTRSLISRGISLVVENNLILTLLSHVTRSLLLEPIPTEVTCSTSFVFCFFSPFSRTEQSIISGSRRIVALPPVGLHIKRQRRDAASHVEADLKRKIALSSCAHREKPCHCDKSTAVLQRWEQQLDSVCMWSQCFHAATHWEAEGSFSSFKASYPSSFVH